MSRQHYIEYIVRMLERASEREARSIYHFVLHLVGGGA